MSVTFTKNTRFLWFGYDVWVCLCKQYSLSARSKASPLTLPIRTPPLPYINRLRRPKRTRTIIMGHILTYRNIGWSIQRNKREVRQVDLVYLVEDLLARCGIRR